MNVNNNSHTNMYSSYTQFSFNSVVAKGDEDGKQFKALNFEVSKFEFSFQSSALGFESFEDKIKNISEMIDYDAIGYSGKPIAQLNQAEAMELVSEDGYFGVEQTSTRLAEFVLSGAGDDIDKLKEGREGIIRGFNEAEQIWGDKLFDINYETLDKALSMIDERISKLGGSVLDVEA